MLFLIASPTQEAKNLPSKNMNELGNQTGRKTTLPQYTNHNLKTDSDNFHEAMKISPNDYPSQKLRSLK
jgi:hypothetical protein